MSSTESIKSAVRPYSHPIAAGLVAVALGLVSKHVFKKDTLPVGSFGRLGLTFGLVTVSSILGEEAMKRAKKNE